MVPSMALMANRLSYSLSTTYLISPVLSLQILLPQKSHTGISDAVISLFSAS